MRYLAIVILFSKIGSLIYIEHNVILSILSKLVLIPVIITNFNPQHTNFACL